MTSPNREAFIRLFAESQQALRRYVRRLVRSPEATDDIVQEAYLRTFEQSEQVEIPRAFLFSAARNLAIDSFRRERVRKTDSLGDFDLSNVVSQDESPEGALLSDERSQLLRQAIEQLPPQCRAACTLRILHGHSYQEIGRRMGISAKTVENHIARALRETHDYLRQRYGMK
ncbi:MAG TPA: sigma-70 family RNA polymerase sigma factor [Steroidobacteraceae bacterium]|nr:sigma-70 family RNA polymerase sigma factor [Steroidobacteraceae bacterium]